MWVIVDVMVVVLPLVVMSAIPICFAASRIKSHQGASFKQATFLSTEILDCQEGTGTKTVFLSVCGNLQHI